jgi:hypothetical protein
MMFEEKRNKIGGIKLAAARPWVTLLPLQISELIEGDRPLSSATKEQPSARLSLSAQWPAFCHAQRLSNLSRPGLSLSNVHPKLLIVPNLSFAIDESID